MATLKELSGLSKEEFEQIKAVRETCNEDESFGIEEMVKYFLMGEGDFSYKQAFVAGFFIGKEQKEMEHQIKEVESIKKLLDLIDERIKDEEELDND